MSDNILNARLQHAVEYTDNHSVQHPNHTSIPLNGEIVFNEDRTNFKVGDGREEYQNLPDFLPTIPVAQIQSDWNQTNSSELDYIKNKPNVIAAKPVFFYDTTASGAYTDFTTILNSLFYNEGHQYSINDYSGILINIDYIYQTSQGSEIINTLTCDSLFRTLQTGIEFSIYIQSSISTGLNSMSFYINLGNYSNSRIFNEIMYFYYDEIPNNNGIFKGIYPFKAGKDLNDNDVYAFNSCIKITNLDNSRLYFN